MYCKGVVLLLLRVFLPAIFYIKHHVFKKAEINIKSRYQIIKADDVEDEIK